MANKKQDKKQKTEKQIQESEEEKEIVIDGKNATLGRLASFAAKKLLSEEKIIIVNCNEIVITGRQGFTKNHYKKRIMRKGSSQKSPKFPRVPEKIVKRTIRGMLPYKKGRGSEALKRVICYNGIPEKYKNIKKISSGKIKYSNTITLKKLVKNERK